MSATVTGAPRLRPSRALILRGLLLAGLALLALLPVLNRMPAESALYVSDFVVSVSGKWICYAVLALAIDLAWGYAGILSLGHGAFFALGGYAMGMHLMRLIGPRGVYGNPVLPDFMVFLGWKELPWYWWGFSSFPFALLMALVVPGLLAGVVGYLAFRSRITGVYFSIITQAMTYALMLAFFRNDMGFGGNNGFTDFKELLGLPLNTAEARAALFYAALAVLAGALWLCRHITRSKLGRVLVAVRDAESRVRFLGYDTTQVKLAVFVLSAMLAGLAGALYVPLIGIINPGEFSPGNSIEAVIWVAVGGRGTLVGALLGAFTVNAAKTWLTSFAPDLWLFVLGGLFVAVTLFLPRGLVGLLRKDDSR
ncbi:MAG TPA: urea ABC transporter permease subunit UrtC [Roseomonas sp.]|nr:urea ABC transporter permease subunit UrtC [Roseomonas sp.]